MYIIHIRGDTHMTSTFRGAGKCKAKMRCYRTNGVGGLQVSWTSNLRFFFIKENWICAMTRYHAEPNINILLTKTFLLNLTSESEVIHCIVCELNGTIQRVVNLLLFVHMHGVVVVP